MNNELIFLTSHFINESVINEYSKLKMYKQNVLLVLDNTILKLKFNRISKQNFFNTEVETFLFDNELHSSLGLPFYSGMNTNIQWYNCDYRYYYVKHFFPNYNFYWQFESDVYSTYNSYKKFFYKYNNELADLLICNFCFKPRNLKWNWNKKIEWIYNKNTKTYGSIFCVSRISSLAIDFLYNKRLQHFAIFKESNDNNKQWLNCEIFVPTELMNNNFKCKKIDEPYIRFRPVWDILECNNNQNHLFHPVKSNLL